MTKSPAFQFYPESFIGGAPAFMKPLETHVYIWLLCLDWNQDGFAYHDGKLASWCHVTPRQFNEAWTVVSASFTERDGRWFNPRLEQERAKQAEWREKSSKGGKASAQAKANQTSTTLNPMVEPTGQPNVNTLSLSLSRVTTRTTTALVATNKEQAVLDYFRSVHPRRRTSDKDTRAVRKALSLGYEPAELVEAIDGNAKDGWHRERHKHDLPYVLRDNGSIDNFRGMATAPKQPLVDEHGVLTAYGESLTRPDSRPVQ